MQITTGRFAFWVRAAACAAMLLSGVGAAQATSVLAVGTADLADESGYIFHGTVTERWVAAGAKPGSIYTFLRFSISDVLKGSGGPRTVVLRFLGGTLEGRTLRVEGMKLPVVGEEGVFFVERLDRHQAYPFYGWDQGRYLVQTDAAGQKTVFTHNLQPIGSLQMARATRGVSTGHAAGINIATHDSAAISLDVFKSQIRNYVEATQ